MKKVKPVLSITLNALYTLIFLFTLLVTANALYGSLANKQPSVFGFMVSEVLSGSMVASGFNKGDFVVTKKISDFDKLKVADKDAGIDGDIITFYVDSSRKPILEGEDRSKAFVVFHEIIGKTEDGEFITKGSSNSGRDLFPIPKEAVLGVYVQSNGFTNFIVKSVLAQNRFLYWVIAVLALVVIRLLFIFCMSIQNAVIVGQVNKGKRRLLDKRCFDRNVFGDFSRKDKEKLITNAPYKMTTLYEFVLTGNVTKYADETAAKKLKGKRCTTADVLCLTHSYEPNSKLDTNEYLDSLPKKNKKFVKYRNTSEFRKEFASEKNSALGLFVGCVIFVVAYLIISIIAKYFVVSNSTEVTLVFLLPVLALGYLLIVVIENRATSRKLEKYLAVSRTLPDCYAFILEPDRFKADEIIMMADEIEQRLNPQEQDADNAEIAVSQPVEDNVIEDNVIAENVSQDIPRETVQETVQDTSTVAETVQENVVINETSLEDDEESELDDENAEKEDYEDSLSDADDYDETNTSDGVVTGAEQSVPVKRYYVRMETRIKMSGDECKYRLSEIINAMVQYRKVKGKLSNRHLMIKKGSIRLLKLVVRGKTIKMFINLPPEEFHPKYHIKDMSSKTRSVKFPSLFKARSNRGLKYAMDIVEMLAQKYELRLNPKYVHHDYTETFTYDNPFEQDSADAVEQFVLAEFKSALKAGQIDIGVKTLQNGESCEYIAGWNHPVFGRIAPEMFVPILEETGILETNN